jgi:hypothetical protein
MHRFGLSRLDLIVVFVLGLTALGLLLVFLPRQRETGLRVQCMNNLKVIGEGIQSFHKAHDWLPPARIAEGYATWAVLLGPHVAGPHPLNDWDVPMPFVDQAEKTRRARVTAYFCPARTRPTALGEDGALGDYAAVAGNGDPQHPWTGPSANGPLILGEVLERRDNLILSWRGRVAFGSLQRGLSYTLLVGEKHVPAGHFGEVAGGDGSIYDGRHPTSSARVAGPGFGLAAADTAPPNDNFGSSHTGVCQFLIADGSVRAFAVTIDADLLGRLATRGD